MASPLDLSGNANEDGDGGPQHRHSTNTRRVKRQVHKVEDRVLFSEDSDVAASGSSSAVVNFLGDFVFVLLIKVVSLFFDAIWRGFSRVFGSATGLSFSEENHILETMPAEQRKQHRELQHIHVNQIQQSDDLDDLRRRVQKLEERRRERAKQS